MDCFVKSFVCVYVCFGQKKLLLFFLTMGLNSRFLCFDDLFLRLRVIYQNVPRFSLMFRLDDVIQSQKNMVQ